jgi:hypothetical protein
MLKKVNRKTIIPKLYRIILLFNYMKKVAEKIITSRLFFLAEITTDLLDPD